MLFIINISTMTWLIVGSFKLRKVRSCQSLKWSFSIAQVYFFKSLYPLFAFNFVLLICPSKFMSFQYIFINIFTLSLAEGTGGKESWPWHSITWLLSQYYFNIESMLLHGKVKQLLFGCEPRLKCLGEGKGKLFCILVMLPEGKLTKQLNSVAGKI